MVRLPPHRPIPLIIKHKRRTPHLAPQALGITQTLPRPSLPTNPMIIALRITWAPHRLGSPFLAFPIREEVYPQSAVSAPVYANVVGERGEGEAVPGWVFHFSGQGLAGTGGGDEGTDAGAVVAFF